MKIFDCHFHIIDPQFPLFPNAGFLPEPFTCENYQTQTEPLQISGGAIVSGSFQRFDQSYLIAALQKLGSNFVGVTQLPMDTTCEEIERLAEAGIRAVRFNLKRGLATDIEEIEQFAIQVYDTAGMHSEFYVDAAQLPAIYKTLIKLPAIAIDHLGLNQTNFPTLLKLAGHGAKIKATGFGRINFDVIQALQTIASINPDSLMFGTDLPSTRAPRPFHASDIELITAALSPAIAQKVLYDNAMSFYRL